MSHFNLLNISKQVTEYACGPAAVQSVLRYWGRDVDQQRLMELFGTTADVGTHPQKMVEGIRALGLQAEFRENCTLEDVEAFTSVGHPVVALGQVWRSSSRGVRAVSEEWNSGHYLVILGTDKDNVYFQDPYLGMCKGFVPRNVFEDHWHQIMDGDPGNPKLIHVGVFVHGDRPGASRKAAPPPSAWPDFRKIGSINVIIAVFPGSLLPYDLLDSTRSIWDSGVVRPAAFVILRKDEHGRLSALEGGRIQDGGDLVEVNTLLQAIAAKSVGNSESPHSAVEAAMHETLEGDFGLSTTDLHKIAEKLSNNQTAIIGLVENAWEVRFKAEAAKLGGELIKQRLITSETMIRASMNLRPREASKEMRTN